MNPRVTVVENIYCEIEGQEPINCSSRYMVSVVSDAQPYMRYQRLTELQQSLDIGWMDECSLLHLSVEKGSVVEVFAAGVLFAYIYPGRSMRIEPVDLSLLSVRCVEGEQTLVVRIYPK